MELVISIIALMIAIASAVYSGQAAEYAKHANEISLHNERLGIFKRLLNFSFELMEPETRLSEVDLNTFYNDVILSEFYFSSDISAELSAVSNEIIRLELDQLIHMNRREDDEGEGNELRERLQGLSLRLQQSSIANIKDYLRLVE